MLYKDVLQQLIDCIRYKDNETAKQLCQSSKVVNSKESHGWIPCDGRVLNKNDYPNATHYCYAYIIDSYQKCSDDGEPSKTAGIPILKVLENNNLTNIICIVIRYFGGIKLGIGGLVRAYTKSVSEVLSNASFNELINGYLVILETTYDKQKDIEYIIKDHYTKEYKENVIYTIECTKDILEELKRNYNILNVENRTIEKEL